MQHSIDRCVLVCVDMYGSYIKYALDKCMLAIYYMKYYTISFRKIMWIISILPAAMIARFSGISEIGRKDGDGKGEEVGLILVIIAFKVTF